jgi:hypothetical protein
VNSCNTALGGCCCAVCRLALTQGERCQPLQPDQIRAASRSNYYKVELVVDTTNCNANLELGSSPLDLVRSCLEGN